METSTAPAAVEACEGVIILMSVALVTETTGAEAPEGQAPETRAPKQTTGRRALASKPVPLRVIWSPPLVPPLLGVTLVSLGMLTLVKVKPPLTVVTWQIGRASCRER